MKTGFATVLICGAFLVIAATALASGTVRDDSRVTDPTGPAAATAATERDGVAEEIADNGVDKPSDPVGAQGEDGPEGDNGEPAAVRGGDANCASCRSGVQKSPQGENRVAGVNADNGHARGPPAFLSARNGGGA